LLEKNYYLHKSAREAYRSYLQAYASHSHKDIFDVNVLDLLSVALSFGFRAPPRVELNIHASKKPVQRRGGGGGFGAGYNKPGSINKAKRFKGADRGSDGRQFSR
jgi:ATP-dependent RNA helicase DDX18/HAS1